jgi:hypothetical protein
MGIFNFISSPLIEYRIEKIEKGIGRLLKEVKEGVENKKPIQKDLELCCGSDKKRQKEMYENSTSVVVENFIEKIEPKYIRVNEKYKHDFNKKLEIAIDYHDFLYNCSNILFTDDLSNAAADVEDLENSAKEYRTSLLKIEEIKKRFDKLLKE